MKSKQLDWKIIVYVYLFLGMLIFNIIFAIAIFLGLAEQYHPPLFSYFPLLCWIPTLFFLVIIYLFKQEIGNESKSKQVLYIGIMSLLHSVMSMFFLTVGILIIGIAIMLSIIASISIYFNRFEYFKKEISIIKRKKGLSSRDKFNHMTIIHDDIKFWINIIINGIYWMAFAIAMMLSIYFSISGESRLEMFFTTGIILILFVYGLLGILFFIFTPLYINLQNVRNIDMD